ncbi:MAG: type III-B CRISPR module RAMP protein Cmr4, partial [Persephonella sp.]
EKKNILRGNKNKLNTSNFNLLKESIYKVLDLSNSDEDKKIKKNIYESLKKFFKENIFDLDNSSWKLFRGNRFLQITCAGQDNIPQENLTDAPYKTDKDGKTGHCGHCIVCKGFGFSKKDISWQGMIFFSDLQILFFPVFTMRGTKWITTQGIIESVELKGYQNSLSENSENNNQNNENLCFVFEKLSENETEGHINLGWLYLPYKLDDNEELKKKILEIIKKLPYKLTLQDIIIVPEDLFSHIVNSNLETRTSVSIDPITGASKEGALFTSEAIPRGTIFYGTIRIFDKKEFEDIENSLKPLPEVNDLIKALNDSKHFYETLGIGGMTTRGFGRLVINELKFNS